MKSNYRRKPELSSRRLQGFDYATGGAYFISINTKNRIRHFGEVQEGEMILSRIGMVAEEEWKRSAEIRPYLKHDVYQFMPDHFHAIVWISLEQNFQLDEYKTLPSTPDYVSKMGGVSKNLSSIVRGFKASVSSIVRKSGTNNFAWQSSFHDRIIRNQKELDAIRLYIRNNPSRWSS